MGPSFPLPGNPHNPEASHKTHQNPGVLYTPTADAFLPSPGAFDPFPAGAPFCAAPAPHAPAEVLRSPAAPPPTVSDESLAPAR
uniref:Protein 11 xV n=1 Tax=Human T-cell leukemia virus 2 TaxID=11909 RepID=Q80822_HTLV2|nr:protein 11 xV [Human T-lymphotropic virus 2]